MNVVKNGLLSRKSRVYSNDGGVKGEREQEGESDTATLINHYKFILFSFPVIFLYPSSHGDSSAGLCLFRPVPDRARKIYYPIEWCARSFARSPLENRGFGERDSLDHNLCKITPLPYISARQSRDRALQKGKGWTNVYICSSLSSSSSSSSCYYYACHRYRTNAR